MVIPPDLISGARCEVALSEELSRRGTVRFVGPTEFGAKDDSIWVGVEWDEPVGKGDGLCGPYHAVLRHTADPSSPPESTASGTSKRHRRVRASFARTRPWWDQYLTLCTTGKWMPYLEIDSRGMKVVSRVENYANYHKGFGDLLRGEIVTGILSQLSGETMHLMKEKINVSWFKVAFLEVCR